jgi:hypothetical protein
MKGKKLPKKNSGSIFQDEEALKKSGVKLAKQKRSKKPSIYDELYEAEEYDVDDEFDDLDETDSFDDDEDDEDEDDDLY